MTWTMETVLLCTFLAASSAVGLVLAWIFGRDRELTQRLDELRGPGNLPTAAALAARRSAPQGTVFATLANIGSRLLPAGDAARFQLVQQFMNAGLYAPTGPSVFTGLRFVAGIVLPVFLLVCGRIGILELRPSVFMAAISGLAGFMGTSMWLSSRIQQRQREIRKSLPDFLDLTGACIQAGQSFEAALARVTDELRQAHPALAFELMTVQREMTLGASAARALRSFAERSGIDVVRQLSTLVDQSQRFGSSMTEALRLQSEMLRTQRSQQAETQAHKAGVKILLPTLLFIFPPVLVILAGPAVIDLHEKFVQTQPKPPSKGPSR